MSRNTFASLILFCCFFSFLILGESSWAQYLEWFRTYGEDEADMGFCVQQTYDSGYIIAVCGGGFDLIKTTESGSTLWVKNYKNEGCTHFVQQTFDSGYILALGNYLIKTDSLGRKMGEGLFAGVLHCVRQTSDLGYIAVGTTDSSFQLGYPNPGKAESFNPGDTNIYLVKTFPTLEIDWYNVYGGG